MDEEGGTEDVAGAEDCVELEQAMTASEVNKIIAINISLREFFNIIKSFS